MARPYLRRQIESGDDEAPLPEAVEHYDFRVCPVSEWRFPSAVSGHADLLSSSNNHTATTSTNANPWSCGYQSGLSLNPQASGNHTSTGAHLESQALDRHFWSNHFAQGESTSALVVSVWFRPDPQEVEHPQEAKLYPLLTWTTVDKNQGEQDYVTSLGCPGYELQIALYLNHILIRYQDDDEAKSCRILYLHHVNVSQTSGTSNHLVLTLGSGTTSVHWNGHVLHHGLKNSFSSSPVAQWDTTKLQVFGTHGSTARFHGAIHQVSLFDSSLTDAQVLSVYQEGLSSLQNEKPKDVVSLDWKSPTLEAIVLPQASRDAVAIDLVGIGSDNESTVRTKTILNLAMEFTTLPAHGNLSVKAVLLTSGNETEFLPITLQTRLPMNGQNASRLSVLYTLSDEEYFNTPKLNALGEPLELNNSWRWNESFAYRILVLDDDGVVVANQQEAVVQSIVVRHKNHRPKLHAPKEAVLPANRPKDSKELLCHGIRVTDSKDFDLNLIRVDVTTRNGRLTLDPQFRHLADFWSCRGRSQSSWQCFGNGVGDRHMTFVAVPSQVEQVLQNLVYEGFEPGVADEVLLAIYDGADGDDCLTTHEHEEHTRIVGGLDSLALPFSETWFDGCYRETATIQIPAMESLIQTGGLHGHDDDEAMWGIPNADPSNFDLADLLFWVILSLFLCCICVGCGRFIAKAMRLCRARGLGVAIRDDRRTDSPDEHLPAPLEETETETDSSSKDELSNRVIVFITNHKIHETPVSAKDDTDQDSVVSSHELDEEDDDDDYSSITFDDESGQISL